MAGDYDDYFGESDLRSAVTRARRRRVVRPRSDKRTWVPPWYEPKPFTPGWTKAGMPPCTDTTGESIKRVGFASLQREMNNPRDVSCETHEMEYAHVRCEALGISLVRMGVRIDKARFWVSTANGFVKDFPGGASGRDAAVKFFVRLLRKRLHYYFKRKDAS